MSSDQSMTKQLINSLKELCSDYKETKNLLGEQIRAVINNDLNLLKGDPCFLIKVCHHNFFTSIIQKFII